MALKQISTLPLNKEQLRMYLVPHTQESLHSAHPAPCTAPSCPPASAKGWSSPNLGVGSFLSALHIHTLIHFFAIWDSHYNNKV